LSASKNSCSKGYGEETYSKIDMIAKQCATIPRNQKFILAYWSRIRKMVKSQLIAPNVNAG
jgi:hypothetical protein